MDLPTNRAELEALLLQCLAQYDPHAQTPAEVQVERSRKQKAVFSALCAVLDAERGPLRLAFVGAVAECAPDLDGEAIADRIETDWLRPLDASWNGDPWQPIPMQLPSDAAKELRAAAAALRTASDHVHSLFHARWLLTDPPMGASVVVATSEEDRKLSESLLANADLLDRAAAMKERQKGPGNRATSTISAQCAAGLLHHLTRNGLPHSSKLQPVHNAAARWAWRYLNLPGDPLECIRTALRSEQPSQAETAPPRPAGLWDQILRAR